ncbi:tagatose-bisphosphate aldolase [Enterococcus hirae]|uniref:tagatose-bisphosphate aldolase n=1 Tax=Enterococcus hirae TaxID=1354 RepID=UPI000B9FF87D|nr:tagatose-bisphosphate aldolase [Enterococcus hirae]OZS39226.1 tagatose-bisphosphate aldolase [Enterococcus hirae]PWG77609.1 tagatose-bisphosphate aldolase [Enterococcus hirae]
MDGKMKHLKKLWNKEQIFAALAIDQRGALRKMLTKAKGEEASAKELEEFKMIVSSQLTKDASAILLDPEYGLPAAKAKAQEAGLLLAYEKTGYDSTVPGRLPDLLPTCSVKNLKEAGADACKFLLYYDVDESDEINERKQVFIERIGSECQAENLPFFLELVSYDQNISDSQSKEYAMKKPGKVIKMMEKFSEKRFNVDVLKVEVPVNMHYVEGYGQTDFVHTKEEAAKFFQEQAAATHLPYIFLSAGVEAELFYETLRFAKTAGSTFNGVLCGRATWSAGVETFVKHGKEAAMTWMNEEGSKKIQQLNQVLKETATPVAL